MSHSQGLGDSECVGAGFPAVNGSKRSKGGTDVKNTSDEDSSASAALNCRLDGTAEEDIDLDERIRSALNELDSPQRSFSTNGYSLPSRPTRTEPDVAGGGLSQESSSDSEGEEVCPNAMGYMPLPQDPDADPVEEEEDACDCPASHMGHCLDVQEGVQEVCTQDQLVEDVVGDATPTAASVDLKKDEVEMIKKMMSDFTLPKSAVPEWAKQVPEEVWKTELMDGLEQKNKKPQIN